MRIVDTAVRLPVTTAVGVILLALFGLLALSELPVQLTPSVEQPEITVTTRWPGASPAEVEREIVQEQEEQLKSVDGLIEMESSSQDSVGRLTLTFRVGADMESALLRVSNRLEQVPSYPADADKPVVRAVGSNQSAIAWFTVRAGGEEPFEGEIATLFNFMEDFVKPEFERVPGVAEVNIYGGREREMQVIVDAGALAARQITINQLAQAIEAGNRNYSGGDFSEGKRRYIIRTVGEYDSPEAIEDVVVAMRGGAPVFVRDVAEARLGYRKPGSRTFYLGDPMIAMNAIKEPGANVLDVMAGLKEAKERLNARLLPDRGLIMEQSYDETDYIDSSIALVRQSLVIGGVLAVFVLLAFLRSPRSTLVVGVAIPISIIGAFLVMAFLGRSLNVISLAGMAFAVGMVVDNAIVVLENIYRHRQMGKGRFRAAREGANEVWGAVLASTLTTVAVFVPVVFVEEEAGQLFRDIAIAISASVALSLIVAITVIPAMSARLIDAADTTRAGGRRFGNLWGLSERFSGSADAIAGFARFVCSSTPRRLVVVVGLTAGSLGAAWLLMPKAEYLPTGNRNFIFGFVQPPPGYNIEEVAELQSRYAERLVPLAEADPLEREALPGGGVRNFFFVATNDRAFMGARAYDESRINDLLPIFREVNASIEGAFAFVSQSSIFSRGIGEGRNIDVELTGPDLEKLIELGGRVFGEVRRVMPEAQARPIPSLDLGNPEVQVRVHRQRAAELGISNREMGYVVNALVDGAYASDYQHQGDEIDLVVKAPEGPLHRTHLLGQLPIATPAGELVPLEALAELVETTGPTQIDRRERQRAITIQVTPPPQLPLQEAMELIEEEIVAPMREEGELGALYRARLTGSADKLTRTAEALIFNFLLAVLITYLLMAALFENFLYPFVIMISVPLAAAGGVLGLALVNVFVLQPLDVLTMLGFVILVGTVVNNAILIVYQALNLIRAGSSSAIDAISESVRTRVRPIFMSVSTSVLGMLPLVLFPGAGSELYRGLGSVVVGGLIVSTLFTLVLVPALFSLVLDAREAAARRFAFLRSEEELGADA